MLRIRLRRVGKKKQPMFRIVVADSRSPRDGRFVESLGYYHPLENPSKIVLDEERARHWLDHGAQPSDRVAKILAIQGIAEIPEKLKTRIALGEERAKAAAKDKPKAAPAEAAEEKAETPTAEAPEDAPGPETKEEQAEAPAAEAAEDAPAAEAAEEKAETPTAEAPEDAPAAEAKEDKTEAPAAEAKAEPEDKAEDAPSDDKASDDGDKKADA